MAIDEVKKQLAAGLGEGKIGSHEQHTAVAKAGMRYLSCHRRAIDQYDLVAPVELVGLTRIEDQRDIGSGRCLLLLLGPRGRVSPGRVSDLL